MTKSKRSISRSWTAYLPLLWVALAAVSAATAIFYLAILVAPAFGIIVVIVLLIPFIYYYGKVIAYWAPVKKFEATFTFERDGEEFEAAVERAAYFVQMAGGGNNVSILRFSIHNLTSNRCVVRKLLGDCARHLARTEFGFWFFIDDRYHSGIAGLVCLSAYNGSVLAHFPRDKYQLSENHPVRGKSVTLLDDSEQEVTVDLVKEFKKLASQLGTDCH